MTPRHLLHYRRARSAAMPDSTPRDAVRTVQSQLRRVRWRRNLFELQRALYLVIATAAVGATGIVLLALRAEMVGFAVAVPGIALAAVVLAAAIAVVTRRRWLVATRASHGGCQLAQSFCAKK